MWNDNTSVNLDFPLSVILHIPFHQLILPLPSIQTLLTTSKATLKANNQPLAGLLQQILLIDCTYSTLSTLHSNPIPCRESLSKGKPYETHPNKSKNLYNDLKILHEQGLCKLSCAAMYAVLLR